MTTKATQASQLNEALREIASHLDSLSHSDRSQFVSDKAEVIGISKNTLYVWLKTKVGWSSGRKKRADAGSTSMSENDLVTIASMQKADTRKNGKERA